MIYSEMMPYKITKHDKFVPPNEIQRFIYMYSQHLFYKSGPVASLGQDEYQLLIADESVFTLNI